MKYFAKFKLTENISESPEGFLICIGVPIARTGEMVYGPNETPLTVGPDGQVIITRDEKEVFRPETIASFEGKPLTITHPVDFVTPENWKDLAVGTIQNVRRGTGDYLDSLLADLLINDKDAINLVKSGLREVSCGYEADYEQLEDGSGKQFNIIGNHLALVDQGRAGSQYAIKDHKGVKKMTWKESLKSIFTDAAEKIDKMEDAESLGGKQSRQDPQSGTPATADAGDAKKAHDELVKMCDDYKKMGDALMEKISGMGPKDAASGGGDVPPKEKENAEGGEQANDDEGGMEDRLKKLEAAVSKLLEMQAGDAAKDPDKEKMEDADKEDEESEDDDFEESSLVGDSDTISRAEILSPGIAITKDVKVEALKSAYNTKDGRHIIELLTGGRAPAYDQKDKVDMLFTAAAEHLKVSRTKSFAKTKQTKDVDGAPVNQGHKSAEDINAINAKFYGKTH